MHTKLILMIVAGLAIVGFGTSIYLGFYKDNPDYTPASISSYGQCVSAGYPVQQSSPMVCRTPDGKSFSQPITNPPSEKPKTKLSMQEAQEIINKCQATGTYSLHSGEAGLILKSGGFQPVEGATDTELQQNPNPNCPLTQHIVE